MNSSDSSGSRPGGGSGAGPNLPVTHPNASPEDIIYMNLNSTTALRASMDFCKMMCIPEFLRAWANMLIHTRPNGPLGNNGTQAFSSYIQRLFEVVMSNDLNLEIEVSVGCNKMCKIYPFGFTNLYLMLPAEIFRHNAAFLSAIMRMTLVEQGDVTSPVHSAVGGAFGSTVAVMSNNSVCYSKFAYNKLLDLYFPRFQFIACYSMILAEQMRHIDVQRGIDVDAILQIADDPLENVTAALAMKYADSETIALRLFIKSALEHILGSLAFKTEQLHRVREEISRRGKVSENVRVFVSDAQRDELRRIDFSAPYAQSLLNICNVPTKFTPKYIAACWLAAQMDIGKRLAVVYPIVGV